MKTKRKRYIGELVVYRENCIVGHLTAEVELDNGEKFFYYNSPRAFISVIDVDGCNGLPVRVSFTAESDGKNPRGVELLGFAKRK